MALPVTIPNTFANATSSIPLSQLDTNFSTLANAVNGLNSGSETLANLKATTANVGVLTVTGNATIGDASTDTVTLNSTLTANTAVIFAAGTSAAPSITTTGDLNTGIFFPAADTIAFAEGGTEAIRIDSSGNLMVGDTGVDCRLWVQRTTDGNAFGTRATFATYAATVGFFGANRNTTNNSFYYLDCYNYGASDYRFRVADSGSISTAGSIQLGDAGAPPTSGVGVKFPATQSASSDANTLDDYEEGTWTPTNTQGITFSSITATYEKIGRTVIARTRFVVATNSNSNVVSIGGLPFNNSAENSGAGGFFTYNASNVSANIFVGTTTATFYKEDGTVAVFSSFSNKDTQFTLVYYVS